MFLLYNEDGEEKRGVLKTPPPVHLEKREISLEIYWTMIKTP